MNWTNSTIGSQVLIDRASRLLSQFELDRMTGLLLPNDGPLNGVTIWRHILQAQPDDIAPTKPAIDRQVEQSKIADPLFHLELCPMAQTYLGKSVGFCPMILPLFQGYSATIWMEWRVNQGENPAADFMIVAGGVFGKLIRTANA